MTKSGSGKKYSLLAAICYLACAIYDIVNEIFIVSNARITEFNIIFRIAMIGMAVALFMKNQKIAVVAAGANTLLRAYYIISYFSLWNLCDFLAYASLVVFIVLSLKGNTAVKNIWFIPAVVLCLGCVIGWITYGLGDISVALMSMLFSFAEIVALLFVGMWVKEIVTPVEAGSVNEYANSISASSSVIGGADKLKMCKELLESGAITQEEFDAKKKQILGL